MAESRRTNTAERPPDASPSSNLARLQLEVPAAKMAQFQAAGYDEFRLAMTWQQVARELNIAEFLWFMERCRVTGLDPTRGQIFAVKRADSRSPTGFTVTHQTSIDGFRAMAAKTAVYAGSDSPEFTEPCEFAGKPAHEICRVTVWKIVQGVRVPFVGECRLHEYYPGDRQGGMWRQYPHNQLAKCSEAQALRKAFPVELGDLAIDGEPRNADIEAQFVDMALTRGRELEAQYIEKVDTTTGEISRVRAGDEYQRLYDEPVAEPAPRPTPPDPQPSPSPKDAAQDDDPLPWEAPAPKLSQAAAIGANDTRHLDARRKDGLCLHPECVEARTQNKAAADTDPPRCLNHIEAS